MNAVAESPKLERRFAGPYEVCVHCGQFYCYVWFRSRTLDVLICTECKKTHDKKVGVPGDAVEVLSWCHRPCLEYKWRAVKGKPEWRLSLGWNGQIYRNSCAALRHTPGAPGGFEWSVHLKDHKGHYEAESVVVSKDRDAAEEATLKLLMAHRIYD